MLVYGHGDVQFGHADDWSEGRSPWHPSIEGDALYGRGSADNKGQHTVDLCALGAVIGVRGKLGYNVTVLIEMGEEAGSVGLSEIVREHAGDLAADLFIGSDGPRLDAQAPTLFLGSRGALGFELVVDERSGDLHSGNWGGRVRNPATVLAAAIGAVVDGDGVIRADFLRPPPIPDAVRRAVRALPEPSDDGGPAADRAGGRVRGGRVRRGGQQRDGGEREGGEPGGKRGGGVAGAYAERVGDAEAGVGLAQRRHAEARHAGDVARPGHHVGGHPDGRPATYDTHIDSEWNPSLGIRKGWAGRA
mgnify:CR=1 FL=1